MNVTRIQTSHTRAENITTQGNSILHNEARRAKIYAFG